MILLNVFVIQAVDGERSSRHNLGAAFVPIKNVYVHNAMAKIAFIVRLPLVRASEQKHYNCSVIQNEWYSRQHEARLAENITESMTNDTVKHFVPNFLLSPENITDFRFLQLLDRYIVETEGKVPEDWPARRKAQYLRYFRAHNDTYQRIFEARKKTFESIYHSRTH